MPPPMVPAPRTATRSTGTGRASGPVFLAASMRWWTRIRFLQTGETMSSPRARASTSRARSRSMDAVFRITWMARRGAG